MPGKQLTAAVAALLVVGPLLLASHCQAQQAANNSNSAANSTAAAPPPRDEGGLSMLFLIKAHAILMTLSWGLFAPMAILFARFQRDPLRRLLGEQLWFQVHRLLNTLTVVGVLLALICILSVEGGKWAGIRFGQTWDWSKIHSTLGIIAVVLALSQPLTALFRCHPDSKSRTVFNIWHGISGYVAWLSAAGALTIACTSFKLFASPITATVLIYVFLVLLLLCFALMQYMAIQKAQLQLVDWVSQRQLFAAAAVVCVAFSLTIVLLVIFL